MISQKKQKKKHIAVSPVGARVTTRFGAILPTQLKTVSN